VVVEILGRRFAGVQVMGCFMAYDHPALAEWLQQKCFAHFLRELAKRTREKTRGTVRFHRALAQVSREVLALRNAQPTLDPATFEMRRSHLEAKLHVLMAGRRRFEEVCSDGIDRTVSKMEDTGRTVDKTEPERHDGVERTCTETVDQEL